MSDAPSESDTCTVAAGTDETTTKEADKEKLDLSFDPSNQSAKPSLRKPKLTEAELSAAVKLGFSEKYLPSSITGREGTSPHQNNSISDRSSYKSTSSASMINNNHSNSNTNQVSGSQNQYPFFVDNYSFGLTREEQDGLLDPLRRPDINQLPPDVLAVLLKSQRFEEVLIPTQRRLATATAETNPSAASAQSKFVSEPTQTRPPGAENSYNPAPNNSRAAGSPNVTTQHAPPSSKPTFSPFAKEFVPSRPSPMATPQNTRDLAYAMAQVEVQDQNEQFQSFVEELDGSDCILSTVTDMISQVSQDPASLNRCTKMTVDVLKKHSVDECTLGIVVTLMFEQMISNPNFCYSGAKILESLSTSQIKVGGKEGMFKDLVMSRIQEEFFNCLKNLEDPEIRVRTLGVLRLLSECYMNFALIQNTKLTIFALAVLELMEQLVKNDKSPDVIKCICQLLKLIGWDVDNMNDPKVKEYIEKVLKELSFARMSAGNNRTSVDLIDMIFKLRSNNWNREPKDAPSSTTTAPAPVATGQSHPVYYELPDSDDDSFGDEGGIMLDDEPDFVQAAYEEFLKMSSKSK